MFENRVLRRLFGPKRNEVTVGWENCIMRSFITCTLLQVRMIKSGRMKLAANVAQMLAKRNSYRSVVGRAGGKRPLGRQRRRWMYNIKMYLRETGWDGMDWIDLVQDRDQWRALVDTEMNLRVPYTVAKFLSSRATGIFSRRAQLHGVTRS
jgi:hypothetical protein